MSKIRKNRKLQEASKLGAFRMPIYHMSNLWQNSTFVFPTLSFLSLVLPGHIILGNSFKLIQLKISSMFYQGSLPILVFCHDCVCLVAHTNIPTKLCWRLVSVNIPLDWTNIMFWPFCLLVLFSLIRIWANMTIYIDNWQSASWSVTL